VSVGAEKASTVIVRLDRTIQYAAAFAFEPRRRRLLDARFRGHDKHRQASEFTVFAEAL